MLGRRPSYMIFWLLLVAVVAGIGSSCPGSRRGSDRGAVSPVPPVPPVPPVTVCNPATQFEYTFQNHCSEPIWIGERSTGDPKSYAPVGGSWAIAPSCASNAACASGTCDLDSGRCNCSSSGQCGGAPCLADGKCSTWLDVCVPQSWSSGTFWPRTGCTLDTSANPTGLTCQTGGCANTSTNVLPQLLDCSVSNNGGSPTNPVSQFEVTSTAGAVNYDVSIAAGYNVETNATPVGGGWVVPGTPSTQVAACLAAGCTGDLNLTCPAALQVSSGGSVIGCLDPCTQCQRSPGGLQCATALTDTWTSCTSTTGSVTNQDLYCAKNMVDGNPQASPNQGTATAFGQIDCFPGTTFTIPTFATAYALPFGQGVCLYTMPPQSTIPNFNDYGWMDAPVPPDPGVLKSCTTLADGTACGGYLTAQSDGSTGYPSALGYTCQTASYGGQVAHLCMAPVTSGLGQCVEDSLGLLPLYNAGAGVANPAWLAAGLLAGGGATPYYDTFKQACPGAYAWQYDDLSSGFGCNPTLAANGLTFTGFQVSLCGSQQRSPRGVLPPVGVVGLSVSGAPINVSGVATNVGSSRELGSARIRGSFVPAADLALDQITLRLQNLLDESGGAGELVRNPAGGAVLPLTLAPQAEALTRSARYETPTGVRPHVVVSLSSVSRPAAPDPVYFSISVDQATIRSPVRCSGGSVSLTSLETSFELVSGSGRPLLVGGLVPWECNGASLQTR